MAVKKKIKLSTKKKVRSVKAVKKLKKVSKSKNKSSVSSKIGKKSSSQKRKISSRSGLKNSISKSRKTQIIKLKGKKKVNSLREIPVKKEAKRSALQNAEKRKIVELNKELDNLNKKSKEAVLIKDAEGRLYCCDENCDQPAVTDVYCRYHYLALWKYLQTRKKLLEDQYLMNTIQELMKSFGENILHFVLRDFKNEKTFEMAIREMNFFTGKEEEVISSETDTNF